MESNSNILLRMVVVMLIFMTVFVSCSYIYTKVNDKIEVIASDIDGRKYKVMDHGDLDEKKQAANHLASISQKVDKLVEYMVLNNLPNREVSQRLKNRWEDCNFRETGRDDNSAAYTVNKGDEMRLCVRNDRGIENVNTSMFVVLHELGHMMSVTYGHNNEFRSNFSYIVHLASALGYYKPQDFDNNPESYCGTVINTTPCSSGTCEFTSIPKIGVEAFGNTQGFQF